MQNALKPGIVKFDEVSLEVDLANRTVWTWMRPRGRGCFTKGLLTDLISAESAIESSGGRAVSDVGLTDIEYAVLASDDPRLFSRGGDLLHFVTLAGSRDAKALGDYADLCIENVYRRHNLYNSLPITTVSLVRGVCHGGGFEAALSSRVIVAEADATIAFPEVNHNLFPGMGAYQLLARRTSRATAKYLMGSGRQISVKELADLKIIDVIAEPGSGIEGVTRFIARHRRHRRGRLGMERIDDFEMPITREQLQFAASVWVETMLALSDRDLAHMMKYVNAQGLKKQTQSTVDSGSEIDRSVERLLRRVV